MTLAKMDQRFQLISHHRDDKQTEPQRPLNPVINNNSKPNKVGTVILYGVPIVSLQMDNQERLCLAQISNTLLHRFSYNEIHNRRVALGITCVQCTPVQLEMLRRAGAMPVSSRRCGMITRREAERLCNSFLGDNTPPRLPDDFAFAVHHECAWGCRGSFLPSRYNSSRAKCIRCAACGLFFSPNKFIFHSHRTGAGARYVQPDAANFNSWRRHMKLSDDPPDHVVHAWEDVKAMFNGGTRKRAVSSRPSPPSALHHHHHHQQQHQQQHQQHHRQQSSSATPPSVVVQMPQPVLQSAAAAAAAAAATAPPPLPPTTPPPPLPPPPPPPLHHHHHHHHQQHQQHHHDQQQQHHHQHRAAPHHTPEPRKKCAAVPSAVHVPPSMPLHQAMVDYVWQQRANPFAVAAAAAAAYSAGGGLPCWLPKLDLDPHRHNALVNRSAVAAVAAEYSSAFRPVYPVTVQTATAVAADDDDEDDDDDDDDEDDEDVVDDDDDDDDDNGGGGCAADDNGDDDDDDDEIDIETCADERDT